MLRYRDHACSHRWSVGDLLGFAKLVEIQMVAQDPTAGWEGRERDCSRAYLRTIVRCETR